MGAKADNISLNTQQLAAATWPSLQRANKTRREFFKSALQRVSILLQRIGTRFCQLFIFRCSELLATGSPSFSNSIFFFRKLAAANYYSLQRRATDFTALPYCTFLPSSGFVCSTHCVLVCSTNMLFSDHVWSAITCYSLLHWYCSTLGIFLTVVALLLLF